MQFRSARDLKYSQGVLFLLSLSLSYRSRYCDHFIFGGWKEVAVHCLDGRGMTQMERGQKIYPLFLLYFPKSINDPVSSRIHSPLKARVVNVPDGLVGLLSMLALDFTIPNSIVAPLALSLFPLVCSRRIDSLIHYLLSGRIPSALPYFHSFNVDILGC